MKLTTRNGEIDLPLDFSLTIERANPLLSDQGDASVPVTLPSSPRNLAALGHIERIDRAKAYPDKAEAILEVGPIRKRGQIVIDTAHRRDGIVAAFAVDSGDLYAKAKAKTLKQILDEYDGGKGYRQSFDGNMDIAYDAMESVYLDTDRDADYVLFPVAVSPYEEEQGGAKVKKYQYNNAVVQGCLISGGTVYEDGELVAVPDLYGLAPFLKLSRLVDILFECLGYTMADSCLWRYHYAQMAIVHNCSDCLCNPSVTLYYKDLVPSCTFGEFLTWLADKFMVRPVVDSESLTVRVVSMEDMLWQGPDADISGLVEGDWTVQPVPTRRVVLTPNNSLEGTEPAAETFDKLMEKYGNYGFINEAEFHSIGLPDSDIRGGLKLRKASGQFYMVQPDPNNPTRQTAKLLGTNHFRYDRANSEETEEHSPADVMPLMVVGSKGETTPYIGERSHAHTSYNGSTADEKQDIIVVQYVRSAATGPSYPVYRTTGTTQRYVVNANGTSYFDFSIGLVPYDLYDFCWRKYNTLLLNAAPHLKGRVRYTVGQLLGADMTRLKHAGGQPLLPVSLSATIGAKTGTAEAEFVLAKAFADGVEDQPLNPGSIPYVWTYTTNAENVAERLWQEILADHTPSTDDGVISDELEGYSFTVHYDEQPYPSVPTTPGQTEVIAVAATFTIHYVRHIEYDEGYLPPESHIDMERTIPNQSVNFTFTAVPA